MTTWRDYADRLTPEQIKSMEGWETSEWALRFCSQFYDPADAHRRRLITLARDVCGALGPGRLN
jgi:hypothetical protein